MKKWKNKLLITMRLLELEHGKEPYPVSVREICERMGGDPTGNERVYVLKYLKKLQSMGRAKPRKPTPKEKRGKEGSPRKIWELSEGGRESAANLVNIFRLNSVWKRETFKPLQNPEQSEMTTPKRR